jgi:DNA-binding CsgD family transcriptional regulator
VAHQDAKLGRVFVGREHQCQLVRQSLDGQRPDGSPAALIAGEAGIGKTALLEQYGSTTAGQVRWIRGVESEAVLPFAAIADLLGPLRRYFDLVPDVQREALEAALALRSGASSPLYACAGAVTVLAAAGAQQRLLIMVDDLQWVDLESRQILLFVARRLSGERVGMLFATRDQPASQAPVTGLYTVRLAGMPAQEIRELVDSLGLDVSDAVLREIVDQTGGNPLAVIETLRRTPATVLRGCGLVAAAATAARKHGGFLASSKAWLRAAELTIDPSIRAERLLAAAADAHLAGASGVAQGLCREALVLRSDPCFAAEVVLVRGRVHTCLGHPLRAVDDLARAGHAVLTRDPAQSARLYAEAALSCAVAGRVEDMLAITSDSEAVQPSGGQQWRERDVMSAVALAFAGRSADARQRFDDVTDWTAAPWDLQYLIMLGLGRVWTEDLAGARRVLGSVVNAAVRARAAAIVPLALAARCEGEWWSGHWSLAYTDGTEALQGAEALGQTPSVGYALLILGRIHAARGDGTLAERYIDRARQEMGSCGMDWLPVAVPSMLGLNALTAADHSVAADHLDQAWRAARERGLGGTNVVPFGGDLVEAHIRAGGVQRAREALAWLDGRAAATGLIYPAAAAARCHGLLADDLDAARECFARAAALHLRIEMPFERARTLLCEGETLRRLRRPVAARPPLLEALAMFESLGARPWAARAEIELAATGARARTVPDVTQAGLDSLTPQEFQVAQFVAVGRNNVEVASSLFVSRKTVEAHLTRIYRKLGVRSRTELARRLASVSIPPVQAVVTSRSPVGTSR